MNNYTKYKMQNMTWIENRYAMTSAASIWLQQAILTNNSIKESILLLLYCNIYQNIEMCYNHLWE